MSDTNFTTSEEGFALLREAIAELKRENAELREFKRKCEEQKPVAWGNIAHGFKDQQRALFVNERDAEEYDRLAYNLTPLFASPLPPKEWVSLSQEDIKDVHSSLPYTYFYDEFARAVESKVKELNND